MVTFSEMKLKTFYNETGGLLISMLISIQKKRRSNFYILSNCLTKDLRLVFDKINVFFQRKFQCYKKCCKMPLSLNLGCKHVVLQNNWVHPCHNKYEY